MVKRLGSLSSGLSIHLSRHFALDPNAIPIHDGTARLDLFKRQARHSVVITAQDVAAVPGADEHAVRVGGAADLSPAAQIVAVQGVEVASDEVLGPVGAAAEVAHQPLEGLVVALAAGRVGEVGAVQGGVEEEGGPGPGGGGVE